MQSDKVEVVEVAKDFLSLRAKDDIVSGSLITDLSGPVVDSATPYTMQVEVHKHVDPAGPLKRTNHSCRPNTKFVFQRRNQNGAIQGPDGNYQAGWHLVAKRDIMKGEDITFDYTTTEFEMARGFKCLCGVVECLGEVKGFKFLPTEQKIQRKNLLSPVIIKLYNKELN